MSRKLRSSYTTLRKIKKPVMIITKESFSNAINDYQRRIRILYPNGKCVWDFLNGPGEFDPSCFAQYSVDLQDTVSSMECYDMDHGIRIIEVIEL